MSSTLCPLGFSCTSNGDSSEQGLNEDISLANRNYIGSRLYSGHAMPVHIDCNFSVLNTNAAGITGLKGSYIQAVWMDTSTTPAAGNPDPAAGTIVVRLQDNYNLLYITGFSIQSPNSAADVKIDNSAMTAGVAYVITTLGNATAAKWHAIGVPAGVTPAVGVSFIAASNGGAGNTLTSRVQESAAAGSGIASIEIVGDPNLSINPNPSANQGYGSQIILQCRDYAGAIAAPAAGSKIRLSMMLSNSSVLVGGSSLSGGE